MAAYEVEGPDGTIYEVTADNDEAARAKVRIHLGQAPAAKPDPLSDVLRSGIAGLRTFASSIPGMFGDVQRAGSQAPITRTPEQSMRQENRFPALAQQPNRPAIDISGLPGVAPSTQDYNRWQGNTYQPQTKAGEVAYTAGAFAPAALTGRGVLSRLGAVALPTAGATAGKEITKDTPFEAAGPMIGGMAGLAASGFIPRSAPVTRPNQEALIDLQLAAEGAGEISAPNLSGIRQGLGKDAERRAQAAVGAQTSDLARNEFNIPIRRGQATGSPDDLRFEQRALAGAAGEGPYRIIKANDDAQRAAVQAAGRNIATQGRPSVLTEQADAPLLVRQGIDAAADTLKTKEREAWNAFRAGEGQVRVDGLATLESRVKQAVGEFDVDPALGMDQYPQASSALTRLSRQVAGLVGSGRQEVNVTALNQIRRSFSDAYRAAANPADRELARRMNEAVNTWLDDVSTSALFDGDPQVISNLASARGLTRDFHSKFGGDKLLGKIIERDANEAQTINALFGASKIGTPRGAVEALRTMKQVMPQDGPHWQALREAAMERIFAPITRAERQNAPASYAAIVENLNEAIGGKGAPIMRELFSMQELSALRRLQFVIRRLNSPFGNPPQTAYELSAMLSAAARALEKFPVLGPVFKFAWSGIGEAQGTIRANSAVAPMRAPGVAAPIPAIAQAAPRYVTPPASLASAEQMRERR